MNNLNLSQNSNNLNDSSKTQEKLYSNDPSLDDILTYSDDISQNQSCNKSPSKQNISIKEDKKAEVKPQIPIICSFNSEITMSFLNNDKEKSNNLLRNKEYNYPKSASKPFFHNEELNLNQKNLNKSFNNALKHFNFLGFNDLFEENIGNNLKDVSGFHASISKIFSEFEIKDISISKSNNDIKKNNSEKESNKLNNFEANNKNLISEEHSNTNSMCNYQNNSNVNDVSSKENKNDNKKFDEDKKDKNKNDMFSSEEIGEINIKMNISLDNFDKNKNKFNSDKKNFLDKLIDEKEINKKDIFTTSNKKESTSFYSKNQKHNKNSIKYTKAQCVQALFQNKENIESKQYILSDAPIKTKDTTSDKKNTKKIISLSPHKLSFEIQKNYCIQISYNKNKNNTINNDLDNNISNLNNNSEISISKLEEINTDKNNTYFYNNECLKQNNTTSFMISPNLNIHNKFIHRKISYQKNNNIRSKKIFINNRNVNVQKAEINNFFYNPNNPLASGPLVSNISCNKKIINELHTPDLNKNKITPMTCVHKGSLIYYNETNNGEANNTIKYNYSNNVSYFVKKNKIINNNNSVDKKPKINNQKKLVYLKSNAIKNNRVNNKENIEQNSKLKQNTIINNKNNSYKKINNDGNSNINKIQGIRKNSKIIGKQLIRKKKISTITNNNNNSKVNNSLNKNLSIKKEIINNNNSITTNNTRRLIRGTNKLKTKSNSNSIINKINNEIIKESSLFHILYNMPARNANTTKNNSGLSSKDEKESTIIQKNSSKEKEKENPKKIIQKKLIKHNANNSFSLYNSFFDKMMDDSKRKNNNKALSKDKSKNKNKNKGVIKKNIIDSSNGNKSHKKINSEINLDSLTTNFNFNNLNIMKRRKNNKSLYNFGNIFFINQNHIIKDEPEPSNSNVIKYINKNMKIKSKSNLENDNINKRENNNNKSKGKNKNKLIVSTKQNPKIINDFSKYRKKKEIILKDKNGINSNKIYNKQEYKETQLISEN